MDRTACTEPQCLYSTAIPLLPLWTVRPVQSLSACTRAHFTFTSCHETCSVQLATSGHFTAVLRNLYPSLFTYNDSLHQRTELRVLKLFEGRPSSKCPAFIWTVLFSKRSNQMTYLSSALVTEWRQTDGCNLPVEVLTSVNVIQILCLLDRASS